MSNLTCKEYMEKVIEFFRDGKPEKPSDQAWEEMALAVLRSSEDCYEATKNIDIALGEFEEDPSEFSTEW